MLPGQALLPGEFDPEAFRTEGEQVQTSQYEILRKLNEVIDSDEFIDTDHFELEVNRAVFGNPLEARIGNFGRALQHLVTIYKSDPELARKIINSLNQGSEEQKDLPGRTALSWDSIVQSPYFINEPQTKQVLGLVGSVIGALFYNLIAKMGGEIHFGLAEANVQKP